MATINYFGLGGVANDVQLGEQGPHFVAISNVIQVLSADRSQLVNLQVANAVDSSDAVNYGFLIDILNNTFFNSYSGSDSNTTTSYYANTAGEADTAVYANTAEVANIALSGWPVYSVNGLVGNVVLTSDDIANVVNTTTFSNFASTLAITLGSYATQTFVTSQGYLTSVTYPVISVNGLTGNVVLDATNISNVVSTASLANTLNSYATQTFVISQGYLVNTGTIANAITASYATNAGTANTASVANIALSGWTYPVTSVNGQLGNVVITLVANATYANNAGSSIFSSNSGFANTAAVALSALSGWTYPVTSVNNQTGNVVLTADNIANVVNTATLTNTLGSYATQTFVTSQGYLTSVTYPVTSVNGLTGNVVITLVANATYANNAGSSTFSSNSGFANIAAVALSGWTYPVTSVAGHTGNVVLSVTDIANAVSNSSLQATLNSYVTTTSLTTSLGSYVPESAVGAANGVAPLNSSSQLPSQYLPSSITGALVYQGTWDAFLNSPYLANGTGTVGLFYRVANAGTNLGYTWNVGDDAIYDGSHWDKIDGLASEIVSVNGMTGAVVLSVSNISGAVSNTTLASYSYATQTFVTSQGYLTNVTSVLYSNYANFAGSALVASTANVALSGWSYPVTSVNGLTGNVVLNVTNITGAVSNTTLASYATQTFVTSQGYLTNATVSYPVTTVNGLTGNVVLNVTNIANAVSNSTLNSTLANYLPLSGGSLSGNLTFSSAGAQIGGSITNLSNGTAYGVDFDGTDIIFCLSTVPKTPQILFAYGTNVLLQMSPGSVSASIPISTTAFVVANSLGAYNPVTKGQWGTQGAYIGWNYSNGTSETDFINSQGAVGNSGGFNFYNVASNPLYTPTLIASISGTGSFTAAAANFAGAVTAGSLSANTLTLSGNITFPNTGGQIGNNVSYGLNLNGQNAGLVVNQNKIQFSDSSFGTIAQMSSTGITSFVKFFGQAGSFSGGLTTTTPTTGDNTTNVATTAFVQSTVGSYLPLSGGSLSGGLTGTTGSFSGSIQASSGTFAAATVSGSLSAGSITASGLITSGFNAATGMLTGIQWANQGGYRGWNYTSGNGETDFFNSKGGGTGGFNFYNVASNSTATPVLIASISGTGTFTANAISSGTMYAATQSAGNNSTYVATTAFVQSTVGSYLPLAGGTMSGAITLASGPMITAAAGTVYIQSGSTYIPNMVTINNSAGMLVYVPFAAYSGTFTASVVSASASFTTSVVSALGSFTALQASSGTFAGALTAGSISSGTITASSILTAGIVAAGNVLTGTQWANQNAYLGWNYAGGGEMDLLTSHGLAGGGFNFYNVASSGTATPSLIASIGGTGFITASGVSAGTIYTTTQSAGNNSTYVATTAFVQTALTNAIPAGNSITLLGCSGTTGTASVISLSSGLNIYGNTLGFGSIPGNISSAQWYNQGIYISWNYSGSGGETDFINSRGGGTGGFNFYNVNSSNYSASPNLIASIGGTGVLTANGVSLNASRFTPVSGGTVTLTTGVASALIQGAGTLANVTVALPGTPTVSTGCSQEITVYFVNAVTQLFWTGVGSPAVVPATLPTSAAAGTAVKLTYFQAIGDWVHYTLI